MTNVVGRHKLRICEIRYNLPNDLSLQKKKKTFGLIYLAYGLIKGEEIPDYNLVFFT